MPLHQVIQAAFVVCLGHGSNNFAKMKSLLEGVRRCCQLRFHQVHIQTDSQILVRWLIRGECNIWYLEDFWDELQTYLEGMVYRVSYVFCEGNVVADFLAKQGAEGVNMDWIEDRDHLPSKLRDLLHINRIGIPYLQIS